MAEFLHKDVKIGLDSKGVFFCELGGEEVTASSLPAIKKKIDAHRAATFNPFKVLFARGFSSKLEQKDVVAVIKEPYKYSTNKQRLRFDDGASESYAYLCDEAALAVAAEIERHNAESARIDAERESQRRELYAKLTRINADDVNIDGTMKTKGEQ